MIIRTRIAPSPTGIAHIGTAYIGLINYTFSKANQGKFIIRIEDTDRERYVPGSEKIIFSALNWLGLNHDEGPDISGPHKPYTQSKRLKIYQDHSEKLINKDKAYYCFCSSERLAAMRQSQQKLGKAPMYDGTCRRLPNSEVKTRAKREKYVIRLKTPKSGSTSWQDLIRGKISFENNTIDDQILLKSDGFPTYHLAVVVDDHLMQISHVIRGEEWISSTPKHIILYNAFAWKKPHFAHTPLLRNPDRSKLSKRKNNVSILWYKEQGFLEEALINYLCLMGWSHPQQKEKFPLKEYIEKFSLDRIQTSQPIFDFEKLKWLNGLYIRELNDKELIAKLKPFLPKKASLGTIKKVLPLVRERIHTLAEFNDYTDFFFAKPKYDKQLLIKQSKFRDHEIKSKLIEYSRAIQSLDKFSLLALENKSRELIDKQWSVKKLFMTIRVAVTGKTISPPLFETIQILGKKETIERLQDVIRILQ